MTVHTCGGAVQPDGGAREPDDAVYWHGCYERAEGEITELQDRIAAMTPEWTIYITEAEPGQIAYDLDKWYSGKAASQICQNVLGARLPEPGRTAE